MVVSPSVSEAPAAGDGTAGFMATITSTPKESRRLSPERSYCPEEGEAPGKGCLRLPNAKQT